MIFWIGIGLIVAISGQLQGGDFMRVGFTGSRHGMSYKQVAIVEAALRLLKPEWLHHGDCVGADEQAHKLAKRLSIKTELHPPKNDKLRAFCDGDVTNAPKLYNERNKDIAEQDILIATPNSAQYRKHSGTWNTIGFADGFYTPTIIVRP